MRGRPSVAPASPALPWWATPRGAAIVVALVAVVAFARSLGNGFTYDDVLVRQPGGWRFQRRRLIHAFKGEMALRLP